MTLTGIPPWMLRPKTGVTGLDKPVMCIYTGELSFIAYLQGGFILFCFASHRLICVSTVEENILKKANQKRMLGDLAIEGGAFTTEFFKQVIIQPAG